MANTYSQIYIQVVFAVQGRPNVISEQNKEELHKYMTGIVRERDQKLLAVHCMPDPYAHSDWPQALHGFVRSGT